jgi:RNA polymerase sigma factor (sigma-70 family)
MVELDDYELLAEFVSGESEDAFARLVERYVNFVYSAALRQTGNPSAAEEVTQVVFIILARKAAYLGPKTILSGWLYQTTRLTAGNYRRTEFRRTRREQEAHMQSALNDIHSSTEEVWMQMAPLLDDALGRLGERDRDAIVLRFFENKSLHEVGAALGTSEDAAKMRVNRGLEKLRKIFSKRGVAVTGALIGSAIAANAVQAAPIGLTAPIAAAAASGTGISAITLTLMKSTMKTMTWLKLKFAVSVCVGLMVAGGVARVALSGASAETKNSVAQPQPESFLIVPGESVGQARKGMTTNEVEAVLGKPDKWQGKMMVYDKEHGMSVAQSTKGVSAVFCGDSMLKYPGVKKFKGRTKEGIGMLSTRESVIKAFGPPTSSQPWGKNQELLKYKALGLDITLEEGKVFNILVDFRLPTAGPAGEEKKR